MGTLIHALGRRLGFKLVAIVMMLSGGLIAYAAGRLGGTLGLADDGQMWLMLATFLGLIFAVGLASG